MNPTRAVWPAPAGGPGRTEVLMPYPACFIPGWAIALHFYRKAERRRRWWWR